MKQITRPAIPPTSAPPNAQGMAAAGFASTAENVFDQVKQAAPSASVSRKKVFCAVPLIVIVCDRAASAAKSRR